MKKRILELLISILFVLTITCCTKKNTDLRLRILANSNTYEDQSLKLKVKDYLKRYLENINLSDINLNNLEKELINHFNTNIKVERKFVNYEAKFYNNKLIPSGLYDTILITINEGKGKNFWTILYPEFFNISFEEDHELEYKSYFYEVFFNSYIYYIN